MKDLAAYLTQLGCRDVRTYIQSGNAVARQSSKSISTLARSLSETIADNHGFAPHVLAFAADKLDSIIEENPFAAAESNPAFLVVGFLDRAAKSPNLARLDKLRTASERFHLTDDAFYLHVPEGLGRSRLATAAERAVGVAMTMRNWRTVMKLHEMAG